VEAVNLPSEVIWKRREPMSLLFRQGEEGHHATTPPKYATIFIRFIGLLHAYTVRCWTCFPSSVQRNVHAIAYAKQRTQQTQRWQVRLRQSILAFFPLRQLHLLRSFLRSLRMLRWKHRFTVKN